MPDCSHFHSISIKWLKNAINNIVVTSYENGWLLDLSWWSFHNELWSSAEDPPWVFEYWSLGVCVCERDGEGDSELPKVQERTHQEEQRK